MVVGDCGLSGEPQRGANRNKTRETGCKTAPCTYAIWSIVLVPIVSLLSAFVLRLPQGSRNVVVGDCGLLGESQRGADRNMTHGTGAARRPLVQSSFCVSKKSFAHIL